MGWFGDQLFKQKPRKSGCICLLLAMLVAFILLVGCGGGVELHSGAVIAKDYEAEHDETSLYCASYGKNMICTLWLPQHHHYPERFRLQISGYDGDGDRHEQWKTVSEHIWNTLQEGDQWSDGQDG